MFSFQLLIRAAVITAAHTRSSYFQPGSDYDIYNTTNLYNCTGETHVSNVTVPNAIDTLPQIEPSPGHGWEQWSLFLHGTFPMILRWTQGNPSGTEPAPPQFDILFRGVDGTTVQGTVMGNLSYSNGEHVKQITIGNNSLTWDSDGVWYNVSVTIDDYRLILDSLSATLDAFYPNVAFYNGLLDDTGSWFGSVPLVRGQVVGSLSTPTENITLNGLTAIRHMFSENPLPSYIAKYTGGTFWGYSTTFYDSHLFYQIKITNGSVHEAAFLGRALPAPGQRSGFSSAWAIYAVTDDDLYSLSINTAKDEINASFSGCSNTDNTPYQFNISSLTLLGEFADLGGGVTWYYSVNGATTAPFNDVVANGSIAGIFEEYQAPSTSVDEPYH